MQRNHRTMSAHTQHTEQSEPSDLSSEEQWHQVKNKTQRPDKSHLISPPTADTRIIVEELVLISDFIPELMNEEKLARDCYFGKYGPIQKSILTVKTDPPAKKPTNLAFITFKSDLDAALAIAAIKSYNHKSFRCIVSYGTSRYCPSFVKSVPCKISDCYFIHELQENTVTVESMRFMRREDKLQRAYDKINDNLMYFIKKEYKEYLASKTFQRNHVEKVKCSCANQQKTEFVQLPTIKETMIMLAEEGYIDKEQYQNLKYQYKMKLKHRREQKSLPESKRQDIQHQDKTIDRVQIKSEILTVTQKESQKILQSPQEAQRTGQQQAMPYLLKRYLNPQIPQRLSDLQNGLQKYYKNREIQLKEKINNGKRTLTMYQQMVGTTSAMNSYIHHKIIQQASWSHPPQQSIFDFATKPRNSAIFPQHQKFRQIIYKSLIHM